MSESKSDAARGQEGGTVNGAAGGALGFNAGLRALILWCVLAALAFLQGCVAVESLIAPKPDFPIESVVLDTAPFPPGTWREDVPLYSRKGSFDREAAEFVWLGGSGTQTVYRYRSAEKASEALNSTWMLDGYFREGPSDGPWIRPTEIQYDGLVPDEYRLLCGKRVVFHKCTLTGRYEEYLIILDVIMDGEAMTYERLGQVLKALDERMGQLLEKTSASQ